MPGIVGNPAKGGITKHMRVGEIVTLCPDAADMMAEYGLHCSSCSIGGVETLEEGCRMHGFDDETIDELVSEINEVIAVAPKQPETIAITKEAACAIREVAKKEGHVGDGLVVIVDAHGGFSLEFQKQPGEEDKVFCNAEEPDVKIYVSSLALRRIGGSTIDIREGRFKLDLPTESDVGGFGSCQQGCGCGK